MATRNQKDAAEKADTQVEGTQDEQVKDTSETVPAGTQTTSDKAEKAKEETPAEVQPKDETPDEDTEPLFVDDGGDEASFEDELPDGVSLGTVTEGGYDVPWTYLTPENFGEEGYKARTSDSDDPDVVKWNVQQVFEDENEEVSVALVPVQATPGQTFTADELPQWDSLVAAGIDPVQFLSGLPVRATISEGETHRRGIPA